MKHARRICDYEGSSYRADFWETSDRRYEDAAERLALRSLLPPAGGRLLDIGAGFGRLADEYGGYQEVMLLDYARSMLRDARARLGDAHRYVCADLYHLPIATAALDTVVQVRVLHHVENIAAAFSEVARVLGVGGSLVLEFANKRHLKSQLRYWAGLQRANPYDDRPYEFVPLNWTHQPAHVERSLRDAGLEIRARRAVSLFRIPVVKRLAPAGPLARLDALLSRPLASLAPGPSQFVHAAKLTGGATQSGLWRCPTCGCEPLAETTDGVHCPGCGNVWPKVDGVYIFRPGLV